MKTILSLTTFVCALMCNGIVYAQEKPGITSVITDQSGKPLGGASVVLSKAKDSSVIKTSITSSDGTFKFENLYPDKYILLVTIIMLQTFSLKQFFNLEMYL